MGTEPDRVADREAARDRFGGIWQSGMDGTMTMTKKMWSLAMLVPVALSTAVASCATSGDRLEAIDLAEREPALCIHNRSTNALAIYAEGLNARIASLHPGESSEIRLPIMGGSYRLIARPVGGERAVVSPIFDPTTRPRWEWTLSGSRVADGLDLEPARGSCSGR